MKARIPNFQKIQKVLSIPSYKTWSEGLTDKTVLAFQSINPVEKIKLPGASKDSTFLIFAGNTGEVAGMLEGKHFIFTDFVKTRINFAQKNFSKAQAKKTDFIVCDANFVPLKDDCVDFAFSYECLPLFNIPYFILGLIRCARKAIYLAEYAHFFRDVSRSKFLIRALAAYGIYINETILNLETDNSPIDSRMPNEKVEFHVSKMPISKEAKKKAKLDFLITFSINEIYKKKHKISKNDIDLLISKLRIDKKDFISALVRLNILLGWHTTISIDFDYE